MVGSWINIASGVPLWWVCHCVFRFFVLALANDVVDDQQDLYVWCLSSTFDESKASKYIARLGLCVQKWYIVIAMPLRWPYFFWCPKPQRQAAALALFGCQRLSESPPGGPDRDQFLQADGELMAQWCTKTYPKNCWCSKTVRNYQRVSVFFCLRACLNYDLDNTYTVYIYTVYIIQIRFWKYQVKPSGSLVRSWKMTHWIPWM
jgi:hypothetical protein